MVRNILIVIALAIVLVIAIPFFISALPDTELDSALPPFFAQHSKTTDLDENVFIALAALNNEGEDRHQEVIKHYQLWLEQDYFSQLENANGLVLLQELITNDEEPWFCLHNDDECIDTLRKHKADLVSLIELIQPVLSNFHQISRFSNYDSLNYQLMLPIEALFNALSFFAAIEIFYHVDDNQLDLAAGKLASMLELNRQMVIHHHYLQAINNINYLWQPLLKRLMAAGYSDFANIKEQLKPLSVDLVIGRKRNIDSVLFDMKSKANIPRTLKIDVDNINFYAARSYNSKPKYLINQIYLSYLDSKVEATAKHELLAMFEVFKQHQAQGEFDDDKRSIIEFIYEPTGFAQLSAERHRAAGIWDQIEMYLMLDLYYLALNLVIANQTNDINELITMPKWQNPYTNKPPYVKNNQLCYDGLVEVCISL